MMDTEMSKFLVLTGVATVMAVGLVWHRAVRVMFEVADRQLVGS